VRRSPLSEAARGVRTLLQRLGLVDALRSKDLAAVRAFYDEFRGNGKGGKDGKNADDFSDMVFKTAGVKDCVMTSVPFSAAEAAHWRPSSKPRSSRYRSGSASRSAFSGRHRGGHGGASSCGVREDSRGGEGVPQGVGWHDEAGVHDGEHSRGLQVGRRRRRTAGGEEQQGRRRERPEGRGRLRRFRLPHQLRRRLLRRERRSLDLSHSQQRGLPQQRGLRPPQLGPYSGLRGARPYDRSRGVNPAFLAAGDGVEVATTATLERLCRRFPKVKFLATVLSLENQHEAIVLASKFSNLHLYGCWWFVNNSSMIESITTMRLVMLGPAFTFQHGDCLVLDQLIYKWVHSRAALAKCLTHEVLKMVEI